MPTVLNFLGYVASSQVTTMYPRCARHVPLCDAAKWVTFPGTSERDLPAVSTRRKELMMSVATQLGLGDPESEVLAAARSRWPGWVSAHPELGVVEDLLELPAWLRQADRDDADLVLLTLAELSSPEGGDDVAATGALAWVLLPGVGLLAARLFTLTPRIDQILAAALWMEARTFPWQRGHRVAANILMNTRKAVMRDLGVGAAADPTWARTFPVAPSERIWEAMPAEPSRARRDLGGAGAGRAAGLGVR